LWNFVPGSGFFVGAASGVTQTSARPNNHAMLQSATLFEEKLTSFIGHGVLRLEALQNTTRYNQAYGAPFPTPVTFKIYGTGYVGSTLEEFNGAPELVSSAFQAYSYCNAWSNNRDMLASYALQLNSHVNLGASYTTSYYNDAFVSAGYETFPVYDVDCSYLTKNSTSFAMTYELRFHASDQISDRLSLDASWYMAQARYHIQNPNVPLTAGPAFFYGRFGNISSAPSAYVDTDQSYSAPRLSAVWRANSNIAIRGSAGGGFALA